LLNMSSCSAVQKQLRKLFSVDIALKFNVLNTIQNLECGMQLAVTMNDKKIEQQVKHSRNVLEYRPTQDYTALTQHLSSKMPLLFTSVITLMPYDKGNPVVDITLRFDTKLYLYENIGDGQILLHETYSVKGGPAVQSGN
jgi:hypothetical protein